MHSPYLIHKYCSRVIGLRQGQMVFDLPSYDVTETVLGCLYNLNEYPD